MVMKQDCINARYGDHFRYLQGTYSKSKELKQVRVSGKCQTWKTRPDDFKLPVKYGMYESLYITPENAALFITEQEYQSRKEQAQAVGQVLKNPRRLKLSGKMKVIPFHSGERRLIEIAQQAGMLGWHVFVDGMYDADIHPSKTAHDALRKAYEVYPRTGQYKNQDFAYYSETQQNPSKRFPVRIGNIQDAVSLTIRKNVHGEYVVRLWRNGKHYKPADYFATDPDDAIATAQDMYKREVANRNWATGVQSNPISTEVRELAQFIINNTDLNRQQTQPIILNLRKKIKRGIYKPELAVKLWRYLADSGAKAYNKEYHKEFFDTVRGFGIFTVSMRNETARQLAEYYSGEVHEAASMKNPGTLRAVRKRTANAPSRAPFVPEKGGRHIHVQQQRGAMWFTLAVAPHTQKGRVMAEQWARQYHMRHRTSKLRLFV
jgi:hypothetical protein